MAFIAITYVSTQDACDKAYRYFRRSSKLSKYKRIGRGHYEFTFHVPTLWTRQDVEETFRIAFAGVKYSPPIIEELPIDVTPEPSKPTPAEAMKNLKLQMAEADYIFDPNREHKPLDTFPKCIPGAARVSPAMAIDPATGDYWRSSQPEYWDCAAQGWREVVTFSDNQEEIRQANIRRCMQRANNLRNAIELDKGN